MNFEYLLPYAFTLVIVVGVLLVFRKYADLYLDLKQKELALLARGQKSEKNTNAYERMLLFLERIKPAQLVTKFDKDLAPHEFVFLVEKNIQQEFDFNASQQAHISPEVWGRVLVAKDDVINSAKQVLAELSADEDLQDFKAKFLMKAMEGDNKIVEAVNALQNELN